MVLIFLQSQNKSFKRWLNNLQIMTVLLYLQVARLSSWNLQKQEMHNHKGKFNFTKNLGNILNLFMKLFSSLLKNTLKILLVNNREEKKVLTKIGKGREYLIYSSMVMGFLKVKKAIFIWIYLTKKIRENDQSFDLC